MSSEAAKKLFFIKSAEELKLSFPPPIDRRGERSKWPKTGGNLHATSFSKLAIGLLRRTGFNMPFSGETQSISKQPSNKQITYK